MLVEEVTRSQSSATTILSRSMREWHEPRPETRARAGRRGDPRRVRISRRGPVAAKRKSDLTTAGRQCGRDDAAERCPRSIPAMFAGHDRRGRIVAPSMLLKKNRHSRSGGPEIAVRHPAPFASAGWEEEVNGE